MILDTDDMLLDSYTFEQDYTLINVKNEHVCEKVVENRKVKIDDKLVISPIFDENEHLIMENKHICERKKVKLDKVGNDVNEMEQYLSLTYDVDNKILTQGKSLANLDYDILKWCFMCVGYEKQCDGANETHIHFQRMLLDFICKLSTKEIAHPLWDTPTSLAPNFK